MHTSPVQSPERRVRDAFPIDAGGTKRHRVALSSLRKPIFALGAIVVLSGVLLVLQLNRKLRFGGGSAGTGAAEVAATLTKLTDQQVRKAMHLQALPPPGDGQGDDPGGPVPDIALQAYDALTAQEEEPVKVTPSSVPVLAAAAGAASSTGTPTAVSVPHLPLNVATAPSAPALPTPVAEKLTVPHAAPIAIESAHTNAANEPRAAPAAQAAPAPSNVTASPESGRHPARTDAHDKALREQVPSLQLQLDATSMYWKRSHSTPAADAASIQVVVNKCFDPRTSSTLHPTERWKLLRVAPSMQDNDTPLMVFQDVWPATECSTLTADDVVVVTQLTVDRFAQLKLLLARWQGCMSVAVLVCSESELATLRQERANDAMLQRFVRLHVVVGSKKPYPFNVLRNVAMEPWQHAHDLGASLMHRARTIIRQHVLPDRRSKTCGTVAQRMLKRLQWMQTGEHDPALHQPWLYTIDADALPSADAGVTRAYIRAALDAHLRSVERSIKQTIAKDPGAGKGLDLDASTLMIRVAAAVARSTVFGVLSFEQSAQNGDKTAKLSEVVALQPDAAHIQQARAWLQHELTSGSVIPFHSYYPDAYLGKVDLHAWLRQGAQDVVAAPAPYNMQFEPYFIAKPPFPRFDEAFRGRGNTKSSWFVMNAINGNVDILTVPHLFLFCRSDFDSHHDAAGRVTSSGLARPINDVRMHQITKEYVKAHFVCPEVGAYRHHRLMRAVREAAGENKRK